MTGSYPDPLSAKSERRWRRVSQIGYKLRDLVFPFPEPQTPTEQAAAGEAIEVIDEFAQKTIGGLASAEPFDRGASLDRGTHFIGLAQRQLDDQQTRVVHVENRIATILGLASLAGIVAFSAMPGFLEGATRLPWGAQIALRFAVGYSFLQLVAIITSAVRGHERQASTAVTLGDMLPCLGETEWASTQRVMEVLRSRAAQLGAIGDRKMTWLACAHDALRHLAYAVTVVAALWVFFYPTTSATSNLSSAAIREKAEATSRSQPSAPLPIVVGPHSPVRTPNRSTKDSVPNDAGRK